MEKTKQGMSTVRRHRRRKSDRKALGQWVGADGRLWVALPDGAAKDLNLSAPARHYHAWATPTKHRLFITANGVPLERDTIATNGEFCVGQKVTFASGWSAEWPNGGTPSGIRSNYWDWVASAKCVNTNWYRQRWVPQGQGTGYWETYGSQTHSNVVDYWQAESPHAWWISGGNKNATLNLTVHFDNGQTVNLRERRIFGVYRPHCRLGNVGLADIFITDFDWTGKCYLQVGTLEKYYDVDFDVEIKSRFFGDSALTQVCTLDFSNPRGHATNELVGVEFYREGLVPATEEWVPLNLDDQSGAWDSSPNRVRGSFVDYIRFRPRAGVPSENIYVTLGILRNGFGPSWEMHGVAQEFGGVWDINSSIVVTPLSVDSSDDFPEWTDVFQPQVE